MQIVGGHEGRGLAQHGDEAFVVQYVSFRSRQSHKEVVPVFLEFLLLVSFIVPIVGFLDALFFILRMLLGIVA